MIKTDNLKWVRIEKHRINICLKLIYWTWGSEFGNHFEGFIGPLS